MKQRNKWVKKIVTALSIALNCLIMLAVIPVHATDTEKCKETVVDELYDEYKIGNTYWEDGNYKKGCGNDSWK